MYLDKLDEKNIINSAIFFEIQLVDVKQISSKYVICTKLFFKDT